MKTNHLFRIVCLLLLALSSACSLNLGGSVTPTPIPPSATAAPTKAPTATSLPLTAVPQPATAVPTDVPTPIPQTIKLKIPVEAINLRQGPGKTFTVLNHLGKNIEVTLLNKARGDQWAFATTPVGQGWLALDFLGLDKKAIDSLSTQEFAAGQVIHGKVLDNAGKPISGIGFAITQGSGDAAARTDATTMVDGNFYAYLPPTAKGNWAVGMVSFDCTSPIMDTACKYSGSFSPTQQEITLPYTGVVSFTYTK